MKKILLGCNTGWGIINFRRQLIITLLGFGYEVMVACPEDESKSEIQSLGCIFIPVALKSQGINPFSDFIFFIKLLFILRRYKPNHFITYTIKFNIFGAIASKLMRINCLCVNTGLGYVFTHDSLITTLVHALYRFAYKFPHEVWFLNEEDKMVFIENGLINPLKAKILPGEGVDTSYYIPEPYPIELNKKIRILLIARLLWDKGIKEFIEAAKLLKSEFPAVEFCLLGPRDPAHPTSIPAEDLFEWVNQGSISYLGSVSDVRSYISSSSCIVLPSYREGLPRVLLEAAALERPIITSNSPGCRDVVSDGVNGLICKSRDADDLRRVIKTFLLMPRLDRVKMGESGRRKVVSEFDGKIVLNNYLTFLSDYEN